MNKFIALCVALLLCGEVTAQSYTVKGNTFKATSTKAVKDTLVTQFKFEDSKGNSYPIIVRKENGYCYLWKVSQKSGKGYRYPLPEDISKEVCKQVGISYTYVKKSKK